MKSLEETRNEINRIDKELTKLYEERMHLMDDVAEYKYENNLPIQDLEREAYVIQSNKQLLEDSKLEPYYTDFITLIMEQGKLLQKNYLEKK